MASCDERFDAEFANIAALKWLPWVGDRYQASGVKLLILGESSYGQNPSDEAPDFTRKLIDECLKPDVCSRRKLYRNLERAILKCHSPTSDMRASLWKAVCFHNLVLRLMRDIKERPAVNDYQNGWKVFFDLVGILKPTHCLFSGTDARKLIAFNVIRTERKAEIIGEPWSTKIGRVTGWGLDARVDATPFRIIFIMHPGCRNFSWQKWSPFIYQFIPNPLESPGSEQRE